MSGTTALTVAIIAAVVSLLVAVGTQVELARRERQARTYDRRRTSLLDCQDAVVAMRGRLREYGSVVRAEKGLPSPELDEAQRRFDDARGLVVVMSSRVDDPTVNALLTTWLADAQQRFVSAQDVSPYTEDTDWDQLHAAFAAALRSASGVAKAPEPANRSDTKGGGGDASSADAPDAIEPGDPPESAADDSTGAGSADNHIQQMGSSAGRIEVAGSHTTPGSARDSPSGGITPPNAPPSDDAGAGSSSGERR